MNFDVQEIDGRAAELFDFQKLIERVSHLLPAQAPIRRFVHHNTLHHFQSHEFHQAVKEGADLFHCEPYPTESFFADQRRANRILETDLDAVVEPDDTPLPFGGWNRGEFRKFRLRNLFTAPRALRVKFLLDEGDLLYKFDPGVSPDALERLSKEGEAERVLGALWNILLECIPSKNLAENPAENFQQSDLHSFMIRFCGAYLDQGISYWPMPVKDGLYNAFLALYSTHVGVSVPWQSGLRKRLKLQLKEGWNSADALADAFARLDINTEDTYQALADRAMALRGWAGMVANLEHHPDLAPIKAPPVTLQDYLAIYFQLEAHLKESSTEPVASSRRSRGPDYELAYECFLLAQFAGLGPQVFEDRSVASAWVREVSDFNELERRRLLLLAYERHYRNEVLDGLRGHCLAGFSKPILKPRFQAVYCIDDREESLRRHMEELSPELETLGYVGFYGIAMAYQGPSDPHSQPLCPPSMTARHLVREVQIEGQQSASSRTVGAFRQTLRASRNSVVRGGVLTAVAGVLAGFPLVSQTLFPGLSFRLASALEKRLAPPPRTRLKIERPEGQEANENGYYEGFTVAEMTKIVKDGLETMGVTHFAPLFTLVGHGSSSLNNPHEAAHDCGATGGGRGGPNARAFAMMANHPEVRRRLSAAGCGIPDSTWFLGAYHNTCDDSMVYYDLDLVPESLRSEVEALQDLFFRGCVLDAHERCRRFENVSLKATPEAAYRHVQARAVTLSQPRPEYGHCTNSICVVGRREKTRGVFFDRRIFLVSYDPSSDEDGSILGPLLESVGPVGAGINLEYYFSSVDASGYGCGTKLPHNVSGLLGVMDGHSSDLRTGLPWQMVEIHEPMRLLNIVESHPDRLMKVLQARPGVKDLIDKGWIQLVAWTPDTADFWLYENGTFNPYVSEKDTVTVAQTSVEYYSGHREHLPVARVLAGLGKEV